MWSAIHCKRPRVDSCEHVQRPAKHSLPSRNRFLDPIEALNTSKQDAGTILWVGEWYTLSERSTEWNDRGIIPNEHLPAAHYEQWFTRKSLNRLRVEKGRCRVTMNTWKVSHTDVCDCGERQTMYHLMTCVDALNCTWTGYPNHCRCQLCQTLGKVYIIVARLFMTCHDICSSYCVCIGLMAILLKSR